MNEPPRTAAANADARFDALVSQYRREQGHRRRLPRFPAKSETWQIILVFCVGVFAGASPRIGPLVAVVVVLPMLMLGRFLAKRFLPDAKEPATSDRSENDAPAVDPARGRDHGARWDASRGSL